MSDHSSDENYQNNTNSDEERELQKGDCDDGSEESLSEHDTDNEEGIEESTNDENDRTEIGTIIDKIMSQRDLPFVKKVGGGKDKIFAEPSHHDFDVGLGGRCNQNCMCKIDMRQYSHSKIGMVNAQVASPTNLESFIDHHKSNTPCTLLDNVDVDIRENNYSPAILESISGVGYKDIGEPDVFMVLPETIQIPSSTFAGFFYANSNNKLQNRDGMGVALNGMMNDFDLRGSRVIWTLKNLECGSKDAKNLITSLENGQLPEGRAKIGINFHCGMQGCAATKKWTLDSITVGEKGEKILNIISIGKVKTHTHAQASLSDHYHKPKMPYDPYKPDLVYRGTKWINDSANVNKRIDFRKIPDIAKTIPPSMFGLPSPVLWSERESEMDRQQSTAHSVALPKGAGKPLQAFGSSLLAGQMLRPGGQVISVQPSYGQERAIRERSIAANAAVENASRPWQREGDETVVDSVTSLMKYCTLQYKSLLSQEMQALYKSLDMNVHFIQEAGYLTDSKHTFVVLLDMCSLVQYIKNGNGVLLADSTMTGLNIPFCDGDDIVEETDDYGFTTTVNFHFSPVNNIPMNTRHDSQSSAFLITGRVIYHHATKSGIPAESLAHGYRRILGILRNWTHTVTKGRVDPRPIAVVHDFGLAEAWAAFSTTPYATYLHEIWHSKEVFRTYLARAEKEQHLIRKAADCIFDMLQQFVHSKAKLEASNICIRVMAYVETQFDLLPQMTQSQLDREREEKK